jgi:threonine dehydrogenase-like Zn-dependent dehydrogenase
MLAMNYRGPLRVRIDHKPEPEILHPQDAIVRVTRSCICGSDLHLYNGSVPDTRVGMTFGHEFTGVVEQIGEGVEKLKVGDHVLVPFNIACGTCVFCQQGLYGNCHESNPQATAVGGIYGYSHTAGGYDGGQAEYVRVPYADVSPTVIPEAWTRTTRCCSPTWCPRGTRGPRWAASNPATPSWSSGPARSASWRPGAPGSSGRDGSS